MRRFFALTCMLLISAVSVHAQKVLSGTVTDGTTGDGLAGVTIFEKGTTNGTFTGEDGKYSLTVDNADAIVVYRFVGFKTIEQAGGGDVTLIEDALQLEDVVVTALGVSRDKKALGYSVQSVSGDELTKSRDPNVVNNLSGRVAGVNIVGSSGNVGSSSRITIRGNASISGANQPLFVINGVPVSNATNGTTTGGENVDYGNVIADLNPEDIESMTVLKGPNAAALYGSRGANGVILITTKKGNEAGVKKGLGVNYSMNVGFSTPFKLPTYQNRFGQGSGHQFGYYDGDFGGSWDGYDESWGPSFDSAINENDGIDNDSDGQIDEAGEGSSLPQHTGTYDDGTMGLVGNDGFDNNFDGTVDEAGEDGYTAQPWEARPDNIRSLFQTGVTLTNNVALTARTDNAYTRFSYTNMAQTGMLPNTDLQRNSFDASFGGNLSSRISMDGNIKYIRTDSKNRPGVGYAGDNVLQQSIWTGRQVDWEDLEANWETQDAQGNNYNWNHSYQNNPYYTLYNNTKPMSRDRVIGMYSVNYKLTDWLTATGRIASDFYKEKRERIFAKGTADHPNGEYEQDLLSRAETNADFLLSANKRFGDKIDLSASFGGNRRQTVAQTTALSVPALVVPGVYNPRNADGNTLVTDTYTKRIVNSLYGFASIGYGGYAYLELTGRNDWSSTLPVDASSYFYPSATASFILSEAVELPSVFDMVKIRGSWAQVGNDTDPYSLFPTYGALDPFNGTPSFTVPGALPASQLRPEITTSLEAGLDLVMLKNRLSIDFTYYNALTKDLITRVDVAPSSGATSVLVNAGSVRNKGIELMVQAVPVKTKSFQWTIGANFSKNVSTVEELFGDVEAIRLGRYWSLDLEARVGEPFGVFRGRTALRDENDNLILNGGLPQVDPNGNDKILGTITPDWTAGISNDFSWKGFTLSALIDIRKGSDLFSVTWMFGQYSGVLEESLEGRNTTDDIINGYVYEGMMYDADALANGDSILVPNDVATDAESWNSYYFYSLGGHDRNIFDASFVKLREVSLNYQLPASLFDGSFIGGLSVGAYGRNLALLYSNVPHIDPESAFGSNLSVQGFEFGALPSARTYGFTLRANF